MKCGLFKIHEIRARYITRRTVLVARCLNLSAHRYSMHASIMCILERSNVLKCSARNSYAYTRTRALSRFIHIMSHISGLFFAEGSHARCTQMLFLIRPLFCIRQRCKSARTWGKRGSWNLGTPGNAVFSRKLSVFSCENDTRNVEQCLPAE